MQALFAFHQSKESNYNIAKLNIEQAFAPDLNSMEIQDGDLLQAQKEESKKLFEENFTFEGLNIASSSDDKINTVTTDVIAEYHRNIDQDKKTFRKQMVNQAEKLNESVTAKSRSDTLPISTD